VVDGAKIGELVFKIPIENLDGLAIINSDSRGPGFNYSLKTPMEIDLTRYEANVFVLLDLSSKKSTL